LLRVDNVPSCRLFHSETKQRALPESLTRDTNTVIAKAIDPQNRKAPTTSDTEH
jgi:hypothetical protein